MNILGAGLAGLIAGNMFQRAQLFERNSPETMQHKAVLRFRSSAVGDAVGIEFHKVLVHKGLWSDGKEAAPSIRLANLYSTKVIGKLADRSIWKLEPVERFVAPEDFIFQLAERCGSRIEWNVNVRTLDDVLQLGAGPVISTIPMPALAGMAGEEKNAPEFSFAPIHVKRWRVPNANVYQTVYFPDHDTTLYRASITGDLLIAEFMHEVHEEVFPEMFESFGLLPCNCIAIDDTRQRFGKIAKLDDEHWRRWFIFTMTQRYNVFSLGRFATWRNILLDDVVKDVGVIRRLENATKYEVLRHSV